MVHLFLWTACTSPDPVPAAPATVPEDPSEPVPPPDDSATTGPEPTADTAVELDCSVLPAVPIPFETLSFSTAEDFDFDGDGYLCTMYGSALRCTDQAGATRLLSPDVARVSAGTRVLATGDWVVADVGRGALVRVDLASGGTEVIAADLLYPNGIEVEADNRVFVTEHAIGRVRQIDADTRESWVVAEGLSGPNGVILSPDGNTLYVGSFGSGLVYAIDRLGPTDWDEERIVYQHPPGAGGGFDGINVDACSNVYITEYTTGRMFRIRPDGSDVALVATLDSTWVPNLRWGSGVGGWDADLLYVSGMTALFAIDVGIPGKRQVLAP